MNRHEAERHKRNQELLERMKDPNDTLTQFRKEESFYPKRPTIKKDAKAIKEIYGQETTPIRPG